MIEVLMTSTSIQNALALADAAIQAGYERAVSAATKQAGQLLDFSQSAGMGVSLFGTSSRAERQYSDFKNWLYSAVNAIARRAAPQEVNIARIESKRILSSDRMTRHKAMTMPEVVSRKAARHELRLLMDHELFHVLDRPNELQNGWEFVYSFVANLCLTGWSYIVGGQTDSGLKFYSIPTTWITPDHSSGPFSRFLIRDPSKLSDNGVVLSRQNVAFAHMPDPANIRGALAPPDSQRMAIRIDDHIQTSQERFFENGIFPSVILRVGKLPHPDVPAGVMPRLSAAQRRQVDAAIRKVYQGAVHYGSPIIVDGLIDGVERFSATQNEMGWDRSEDKIRARILSMFGLHPFILGEMAPSSYAQAFVVERQNCEIVNSYLGLLSLLMTNFASSFLDDPNLVVWWEKCEPSNPQERNRLLIAARRLGDITQNEMRAELGLPPDEDKNEVFIPFEHVGPLVFLLTAITNGEVAPQQAVALLEAAGLPTVLAERIAGFNRNS